MTIPELLLELPKSSREIAEKFRTEGIKGSRACSGRCPITEYFKRKGILVVTGPFTLVAKDGDIVFSLPQAVCDFILYFDRGCYPELDEYWRD